MNWEILLVLLTLVAMLVGFVWERIPAELTALTGLAILLLSGILPTDRALAAFSNAAPITVGAMFVLSAALEKSGAIQVIASRIQHFENLNVYAALLVLMMGVAVISAFVNNTPVVVVFLPVVLSLAKQLDLPASKLLIPLSFASIFGGSCTLIGTSTNIIVSSVAASQKVAPLSMFELAWIGVPLLIAGCFYILFFGYRILPRRETISSILSEEERREFILEAYVGEDSPLLKHRLADLPHFKASGLRPLEVVRHGVSTNHDASKLLLEAGDRILVAASARTLSEAHSSNNNSISDLLQTFGMEQIATIQGSLIEVALRSESSISGWSFQELGFRQRYRLTPIAIHRNGVNVYENFATTALKPGDILLLLGSSEAIQSLRKDTDFVVIDETPLENKPPRLKLLLSVSTIAGVIAASSFGLMPIAGAAIIGCILLLLTRCLSPQEAYKSIHWPILFLIFAMLGVGDALELSGASRLISETLVTGVTQWVAEPWRPLVLLAAIYLITTTLTEILSNNAAAILMTTLAIGAATTLGVDARPFVIAVAVAASASFATPIGYQTNTYVYGIGGYRFSDFLKIGIPLNLLSFILSVIIIPLVWKF